MESVRVKICGLTRVEDVRAAAEAGAAYVGFVFFPKSPRNVSVEAARELALEVPPGIAKVGLLVDPSDALLDEIDAAVPLDMIQLHGRETPERVAEVLASSEEVDASVLDVWVTNGVVTLVGPLRPGQEGAAERIARSVRGVSSVRFADPS